MMENLLAFRDSSIISLRRWPKEKAKENISAECALGSKKEMMPPSLFDVSKTFPSLTVTKSLQWKVVFCVYEWVQYLTRALL